MPTEDLSRNGPIQVFAEGLLGFLQLKNNGRNPHNLDNSLYGMIEIRDWLFASRERIPNAESIVVNSIGFKTFTTPIVVPAAEMWYVTHYSVFAALGAAGDSILLRTAMGGPMTSPGTTGVALLGDARSNNGAGVICEANIQRPFFAPQGSRIGFYVSNIATVGGINVEGAIRYVRLPI